MNGLFGQFAAAYVRGKLPDACADLGEEELLRQGEAAGLRLNRFKRTSDLPRVRAALGAIRGIGPESLLDIGSGRGVFLWPLLDAFPQLAVTAIEPDARRRGHLEAVRDGGVGRLAVLGGEGETLPLADASFDVVTILEVLEHQERPLPLAREAVRVARRFVIASVPLHPDDNPEHVPLFTAKTLRDLLTAAGARSVRIDHVPGHIVAVAAANDREAGRPRGDGRT